MNLEYEDNKYYFFILFCFICHKLLLFGYYITEHIDEFFDYIMVVT